jgi:hypothetical protein
MKKLEMIRTDQWQNDPQGRRGWSGKLKNLGKPYFLSLVAAAVRDVNEELDVYGITYARKSMMRCGLSSNQDGVWKYEQLFLELQEIIVQYPNHFHGELVSQVLLLEEALKDKKLRSFCV